MFRNKKFLHLFSALNALLMTVFSFLWLNNSYILLDDEEYMIKMTSGIRNPLLGFKEKPAPSEFLFIDIAWEKQLADEKTPDGQKIGNRAITNRERLAELLGYMNKTNQHKFIILDVFLKDSSQYKSDSTLQDALSKTKNILIPYHTTEDGTPDMPIFKAPVALSDYDKDDLDNNFTKFKSLYNDTIRTTPLVLYEKLHGEKFTDHGLFGTSKGQLALSSFILDLRIWQYNLSYDASPEDTINKKTYQILYLSDLLQDALNPEISDALKAIPPDERPDYKAIVTETISELTKNRIVVIGDFSDADIHETIYGATAGPLILLNVYLALREGDNIFSIWFILFLFAGFYYISYNCFLGRDVFVSFIKNIKIKNRKLFNRNFLLVNFFSYLLYFIVLSVLSFFLFNIHLTILILAIYMELLEKAFHYLRRKLGAHEIENGVKDR